MPFFCSTPCRTGSSGRSALAGGTGYTQPRSGDSAKFNRNAALFKDELDPTQWQGNILALISGIAFAGVVLGIRRDRDHNPIRSVFWGNLLTALIVIPFALIYDSSVFTPMFDYRSILGLLWLGIFQMALAYVLYVNAISHLPAIEVAILSLIEPVLNPARVYIAIGETPSFWALIGSSLILLSVLLRALLAEPNQPDEPSQPNST